MQIEVNGESRIVPERTTVIELLVQLGYGETLVAVERNTEIVPRAAHPTTALSAGDKLEIVQFVGGG